MVCTTWCVFRVSLFLSSLTYQPDIFHCLFVWRGSSLNSDVVFCVWSINLLASKNQTPRSIVFFFFQRFHPKCLAEIIRPAFNGLMICFVVEILAMSVTYRTNIRQCLKIFAGQSNVVQTLRREGHARCSLTFNPLLCAYFPIRRRPELDIVVNHVQHFLYQDLFLFFFLFKFKKKGGSEKQFSTL